MKYEGVVSFDIAQNEQTINYLWINTFSRRGRALRTSATLVFILLSLKNYFYLYRHVLVWHVVMFPIQVVERTILYIKRGMGRANFVLHWSVKIKYRPYVFKFVLLFLIFVEIHFIFSFIRFMLESSYSCNMTYIIMERNNWK